MAHAVLGLLDLDAVVAEEPRRVVHQVLERHQHKIAFADQRMRPSSASIFISSSSSTNGASSVLISMTALANASWRVS